MNVGGDAQDTSPFVSVSSWAGSAGNDNLHYDVSKLQQWETAFGHVQKKGVHLHFVLNEAEGPNKRELDDGTLGTERKLFYRELISRFGHHNALQWNVSEEYDLDHPLGPDSVKAFAGYIQQLDPYDHPITVHQAGNPDTTWTSFLGDGRFSLTSFQYVGSVAGYGAEVEEWRAKSKEAGRPINVSMDELRSTSTTNADAQRKEILWPTYLSGSQVEWYIGAEDQSLEDFRKYQAIWDYTCYARKFIEGNLPFWEMEPRDALLTGESTRLGGGQVFAKAGEAYAVYLPDASATGSLGLSGASGLFEKRWYNTRTGDFEGTPETVNGGSGTTLGAPPGSSTEDWVVLLKACPSCTPPTPTPTGGGLKAEYYDNNDLTNLKRTRTDSTVNFDWDNGSPDPSIGPDTFAERWTGQVKADYSETYTFYTTADDMVRLWVNGKLVIDRWTTGLQTNQASVALQAQQWYDIKMEYGASASNAAAKLEYSSPSTTRKVVSPPTSDFSEVSSRR